MIRLKLVTAPPFAPPLNTPISTPSTARPAHTRPSRLAPPAPGPKGWGKRGPKVFTNRQRDRFQIALPPIPTKTWVGNGIPGVVNACEEQQQRRGCDAKHGLVRMGASRVC